MLRYVLLAGMPIFAIAGHAGAAELKPAWSCQIQIIVTCLPDCQFGPGPAAMGIDTEAGTLEMCQGEHCESGTAKIETGNGFWDGQPYLMFTGRLPNIGDVRGVISPSSKTFYLKDESGENFGTCENR